MLVNYDKMSQSLFVAIVDVNKARKDFVADEVIQMVTGLVHAGVRRPLAGVYRLTMNDEEFLGSEVTRELEGVQSGGRRYSGQPLGRRAVRRGKESVHAEPVQAGLVTTCFTGHYSAVFGPIRQTPLCDC